MDRDIRPAPLLSHCSLEFGEDEESSRSGRFGGLLQSLVPKVIKLAA
jgi:hypothetical protein